MQDLVQKAIDHSPDQTFLSYNTLASFIASSEYGFLKEAIPKKITVRRYYELSQKQGHCVEDEDDSNQFESGGGSSSS